MSRVELPDVLADLVESLTERGFSVTSDVAGTMGSRDLMLRATLPTLHGAVPARVNLDCDRLQWVVSVAFGVMRELSTPMVWKAALEGVPIEELTLAQDAEFLRDRIEELAQAYQADPAMGDRILRMDREYTIEKFGL